MQFRIECGSYVLGPTEAMLFAAEQEVSNRNCLVRQSGYHQLGLAGQNDFVVRALEKDHWHRETVDVVDGGAVGVRLLLLQIWSNKPIQVMGLEFMRIAGEGRKVAHAIVAGYIAMGSNRDGESLALADDHGELAL
jgi:hypothetical protein